MKLVVDIETNDLHDPTKVWCVVSKDLDSGEVKSWSEDQVHRCKEYLNDAETLIGHNFLAFDLVWLNDLLDLGLDRSKVIDTLVLSHLHRYRREDGGHSLEAWGQRLNFPKGNFNEFDKYSDDMLRYCKNDVELTARLYRYLMHPSRCGNASFKKAIAAEHHLAAICSDMHRDGFGFDVDHALLLLEKLKGEVSSLDTKLLDAFPPKSQLIREITPRKTKHGTISKSGISNWYKQDDYSIFEEGSAFSLVEWVPFNPGSVKQIIERLDGLWSPTDKTKGYLEYEKGDTTPTEDDKWARYGWKINEANLATLSPEAPPSARLLVERLMLASRCRTLEDWISCYNEGTKSIHGRFNPIGTWTHRMSHNSPNMGNVAAKKSIKYNTPYLKKKATEIGGQMRALFKARGESWLVGADMDQAHLRILCHLIKDEEFKKALIEGDKALGTDLHTINQQRLGHICLDRDRAKTFIYSFLNGAGVRKIAEVFGCRKGPAREALDSFIESYPGLARLKDSVIPMYAKRGYFIGLDGRPVQCDSEHHMLAGILQNAEKVLMTYAMLQWRQKCLELGLRYRQVNFIHDEWQTEVFGSYQEAQCVAELQVLALNGIGNTFDLWCPTAGAARIGKNWEDTH